MPVQLTLYQPLAWLAVILVLIIGFFCSLVDRPRGLHVAAFLCRTLAVAVLILALCRPAIFRDSNELHVLFLVDVSESVDLDATADATTDIQAAIDALDRHDSYTLATVGNGVRFLESPEELTRLFQSWASGIADDTFRSATRLSEALLATRLEFPAGKAKRVVLFTDGHETHGRLGETLATLAKEGVDVFQRPLAGLSAPEAALVALEPSTPSAFEGEIVRMRATMAANQDLDGTLRILHKGVAVTSRELTIPRGESVTEIDIPMTTPGESLWTAELVPEQDHFPLNNQLSATVRVSGQPRLLVLHETPRDMRNFGRAMKEQEIEVDTRGLRGLPETMEGLLAFHAIIFADIAATELTSRQMDLVKRYVMDFGGGVAMLGSENSFGLGGYFKTPIEEVLPLISRFEKEKEKPSLAMVLVMDKSGSMSGLPIELARQAAKASVELLSARDQIGVIGFDSQAQVISELRPATESDAIHAAIDSLDANGGTDVYQGMLAGKSLLDNTLSKIKHMIVLTDGQTHDADFHGLVQAMTENAVTISTVALGENAARELLASIAEMGRGRYYETMDPATVPQIFTKETMQASRSAIKEDLYATLVTADHALMSGYSEDDLPFSLGYVMTEPKPTSQVILAAETGDPLLALGKYGLGNGLAYTSDLTEKWGAEWLAWEECGKFWAQAFRAIVRKTDSRGMQVDARVGNGQWDIAIERRDPDRQPVSRIPWDAEAVDENGRTIPVEITEVGLGRYRGSLSLSQAEKLTLRLKDNDNDLVKVLHYERPYPKEYALSDAVPESIRALPTYTLSALRSEIIPAPTRQSVAPWFYGLALALLLLGVVLRRV